MTLKRISAASVSAIPTASRSTLNGSRCAARGHLLLRGAIKLLGAVSGLFSAFATKGKAHVALCADTWAPEDLRLFVLLNAPRRGMHQRSSGRRPYNRGNSYT